MMYDRSDGCRRFRTFNAARLAWWHTYKHASLKLWDVFACDVFAPLWHHLYPGHIFFRHPGSLPCVHLHMMYLHLAYPFVKDQLDALGLDQTLNPASRIMVQDLQFLLGMAIPVVIHL
jgi:hypothetical protein